MKHSCVGKVQSSCGTRRTNRKRQNWLSATDIRLSHRQITFSCSVSWTLPEWVHAYQIHTTTPGSTRVWRQPVSTASQTKVMLTYLNAHPRGHTQTWGPEEVESSGWAEGRKTRAEPSSSSFTFNWEVSRSSSSSSRRLKPCRINKCTHTNWGPSQKMQSLWVLAMVITSHCTH